MQFLSKLFGPNWRTSLIGVLQLLAGTAYNYIQSMAPGAHFNWNMFGGQCVLALLAFVTKDAKVTGGSVPANSEAGKRVLDEK